MPAKMKRTKKGSGKSMKTQRAPAVRIERRSVFRPHFTRFSKRSRSIPAHSPPQSLFGEIVKILADLIANHAKRRKALLF